MSRAADRCTAVRGWPARGWARAANSLSINELDCRIDTITAQPFRARFRLRGRERALVPLRGTAEIRRNARELIAQRLAPASPARDGHQTPYRNHPVFIAQHATATCCRRCLERNHRIPRGRALGDGEQDYVVDVIMRWIEREVPDAPR